MQEFNLLKQVEVEVVSNPEFDTKPGTSSGLVLRAHICHEYHELYWWRKNCHVEKFWRNFGKFWENLGDFATIYALSCGEKFSTKSTFVEKKIQI